MTLLNILLFVLLVIASLYFLEILLITAGLICLKRFHPAGREPLTTITVIIPVRNEEDTIGKCLEDICLQDYPHELLEVVVVNDASSDRTEEIVHSFARTHPSFPLKIIMTEPLGDDRAFKKHSMRTGVEASSGILIITTDADTRRGPRWISSIGSFYEQYNPEMILGPVAFLEEHSLFERMQGIEFAGLMSATAGSCSLGFPLMCNGANLAFRRKAYSETKDPRNDFRHPSGDDLFLMMKIRKQYGSKAVKFLYSEDAIVYTTAKRTPSEFISQRLRWVSKNRGYTDRVVSAVAVITYLFNLLLLTAMIAGIFDTRLLVPALFLFGVKMILELPSVSRMVALFRKPGLLFLYPLAQAANLVYVSAIGLLGNFVPYEWKGRKISPLKQKN